LPDVPESPHFEKGIRIFMEREQEARQGVVGAGLGDATGGLGRLFNPSRDATPTTTIRARGRERRRRRDEAIEDDELNAEKMATEKLKQRKLQLEIEELEAKKRARESQSLPGSEGSVTSERTARTMPTAAAPPPLRPLSLGHGLGLGRRR
jgi:hypothetical protein